MAATTEREDIPFLTFEERQELAKWPHTLDYTFSAEELEFLDKNGYVVIKQLFDRGACEVMVEEIFERSKILMGLDRLNPTTWESMTFADVWHNPAFYQIRQFPKLYSIFAQLLRTHDLTVSIDRVSLKPPAYVTHNKKRLEFADYGLFLHNDMNLWDLSQTKYQGGLALEDSPKGNGGFTVVPGFHKLSAIVPYRQRYEAGELSSAPRPPPSPDRVFVPFLDKKFKPVEVPLERGDFVVWNSRLPHGNESNKLPKWRIQCFVRFIPNNSEKSREYREEVASSCKSGEKPRLFSTGNFTGYRSDGTGEVPLHKFEDLGLTSLGQRLLGLEEYAPL